MSASDNCCCCSEPVEDKQSLNPSGRRSEEQTVITQPKPQNYTSGNEKGRKDKQYELSVIKDEKDQLLLELQNLQARSREEEDRYKKEIEKYNAHIKELNTEVENLKSKNDELLTRLSAAASARLTDENPNIADLSDVNRPTKLAEQFSELYDNEWTCAFEALTDADKGNKTEKDACKLLLHVLTTIYAKCYKKAQDGLEDVTNVLATFYGMDMPSKEILKALKDDRKKNYSFTSHKHREDIKSSLQEIITEQEASFILAYVEKCISLCWLMAIQDPPVYINVEIGRNDEKLDTDKYKHYTQSGTIIDYLVWPALYLCKEGNVLSKGVAQGKRTELQSEVVEEDFVTHL